ncbi:MAG: DUF3108 domain-containing protein [Anaeromyxobacter sp.]|nr:DUF3108 domain-containing protein [Anaeromyxobacter sp.]MBL0276549.1 DUF3108 domain-containing protein [Anaeromyxobacter sp.]
MTTRPHLLAALLLLAPPVARASEPTAPTVGPVAPTPPAPAHGSGLGPWLEPAPAHPPAHPAAHAPGPTLGPALEPAQPTATTAPPTAPVSPHAGAPHTPGEAMEFVVELGGFKAGVARLSVGQREGSVLPVYLVSRSAGLAAIVSLKQSLVSLLDTATGLPKSSQLEGIEPSYRHTDTARFDRTANVAEVREVGRYDRSYRIEVPPGTLDFVALVFRLRLLPLDPGASLPFPVLSGRTVSTVVASVEGRESVKTRVGTFPAIKVRVPTGLSGKFSEKSPTYIWFSDDAERRVVRISTNFGFGRAVAILSSYTPGLEPG